MSRLQEIEERLNARKKNQSDLQTQLDESAAKMTRMKDDYESAIKNGVYVAALDAMLAESKAAEINNARLEIQLNDVTAAIDKLLAQRETGHRMVEHEKYLQDVEAGRTDALTFYTVH